MTSSYRGSPKHKDRPSVGRKGTLCPEWTHATPKNGLKNDPNRHCWENTEAHRLFLDATVHSDGRRFATKRGIAFEAKQSGDDTWHGFPIPWESVPPNILDQWLQDGKVSRRDVKLNRHPVTNGIRWALDDNES
jgi:hypothetical protein